MKKSCSANDRHCLLVSSASPFFGGNTKMMTMCTNGTVLSPEMNTSDYFIGLIIQKIAKWRAALKRYLVISSWDGLFGEGVKQPEL